MAISNSRLVSVDADAVAFRWKDYRIKNRDRQKVMRLATGEATDVDAALPLTLREPCPDCGGPMRIGETFRRGERPMTRAPPRETAA